MGGFLSPTGYILCVDFLGDFSISLIHFVWEDFSHTFCMDHPVHPVRFDSVRPLL